MTARQHSEPGFKATLADPEWRERYPVRSAAELEECMDCGKVIMAMDEAEEVLSRYSRHEPRVYLGTLCGDCLDREGRWDP